MNSKDIPVEAGLYAALSQDGLILAVGLGSVAFAVAKLKSPIPPEEWRRLLDEEWADPTDGAISRAAERAGHQYGLEGMLQAVPLRGEFIVLGNTLTE